MFEGVEAYPLTWPIGWKRNRLPERSRFKTTFGRARDELFRELRLMGIADHQVILSSNIPLRRDGLPYAGQANPSDPGIAVYFRFKSKPMAFACDNYTRVEDNLWAICKTVEVLRGIQRWGASEMLERSFSGFAALPPPVTYHNNKWWEVLNVSENASATEIGAARRRLAELHHPDRGGDSATMAKINQAYDEGMRFK